MRLIQTISMDDRYRRSAHQMSRYFTKKSTHHVILFICPRYFSRVKNNKIRRTHLPLSSSASVAVGVVAALSFLGVYRKAEGCSLWKIYDHGHGQCVVSWIGSYRAIGSFGVCFWDSF